VAATEERIMGYIIIPPLEMRSIMIPPDYI